VSGVTGRGVRTKTALRVVGAVSATVISASAGVSSVLTGYLGTLTVAATRRRWQSPAPSTNSTLARFALMIPAHNEAAGITRTIDSLQALDYPTTSFSIHVVADNCTDDTSGVVTALGATAHDRHDAGNPGKGPALNWLFDRLVASGVNFDAVVIIDADTSLDRGFLRAMDRALAAEADAAQGFYGVRDIGGSTAAALRYAALACRHHLRPLGRTRLGGSSGLYGNGMVFRRELMAQRRWSGHLTEDMEFQMDLLLDGVKVAYVPDALLEAEMPDNLASATTQNERWELGRIQMAKRYLPTLLSRVRCGDTELRTAYIDSTLDHLVPPLSVLVALTGATTVAATAQSFVRGRRLDKLNLLISVASSLTLSAHVVAGLRSVKAPASVYRSLLRAPRMVVWKLGVWVKVLLRPDSVTWTRTVRNAESQWPRGSSSGVVDGGEGAEFVEAMLGLNQADSAGACAHDE